ncbi:MAG: ATP-binding cassette domain-containing protein [Chlorobia bacterium]|nr:ATP-binding cassette domain-containing protein [Fimbriimonadaceae bacterium]
MTPLVDLQNVTVVRDGFTILHNLSLQIDEGQHTAILGPNGSGKSTLIRVLAHEIYPFAGRGSARIAGKERWAVQELRKVLGMVSPDISEKLLGNPTVLDIAVSGLLGTFGVVSGYEVTSEMWNLALESLANLEVDHLAHRSFETLSTGESRRVLIARALALRPQGLVLDEPTSGLDMKSSTAFLKTLGDLMKRGTTLILVTHHVEEVLPQIQQVAMLSKGRLIECGERAKLMTPAKIADLYDIPIESASASLQLAQERCPA